MTENQPELYFRAVGHLPLARAVLDDLGICEVIEEVLPKHPLSKISDAECATAFILNLLSSGPAMYRMDWWLQRLDTDLLFGKGVSAAAFNDTRLATALDHLDAAGTDTILAKVVERFLSRPGRETVYSVHHDTTSVSLYGKYEDAEDPVPKLGFSKKHRPDLKQLIFGLSLHGSAGLPLAMTVTEGSTPDSKAARDHLALLAKRLPPEDEVTFVTDCKGFDAITAGQILGQGFHFVSLVADTFGIRRKLIEEAWKDRPDLEKWPILAKKPGRLKDAPWTAYRGASVVRPFRVLLNNKTDPPKSSFEELRFLVVYSDALAEHFDAALPKRLDRERENLEKEVAKLNKTGFVCEPDASIAAAAFTKKAVFLKVVPRCIAKEKTLKRNRRGRPRKEETPIIETTWHIELTTEPDKAIITEARKRASCFVLVTDWLPEMWDDEKVLAEYRHQSIIEGHTGFRWIKGPAAVEPVFLKTPTRIRAMGLLLVLALMVRNYIQATLRNHLKTNNETLPHPFTHKEVTNLTTEMAMAHFGGIQTGTFTLPDGSQVCPPPPLSSAALRILAVFGVDREIFAKPHGRFQRKIAPDPRGTPGM